MLQPKRLLTPLLTFRICTADRYLDKTARVRALSYNKIDYMCRFDQKYSELSGSYDRFDGNPFT